MKKQLYTVTEVCELISENKKLVITADESLLDKLPSGDWIGGTIPYFMTEEGGLFTKELLYVQDFTEIGTAFKFSKYNEKDIKNITQSGFENEFSVLILPMDCATHISFSLNSLRYNDIFKNPIVGYIAGMELALIGKINPKVYFGPENQKFENAGVVLHIELPKDKVARTEIINPNTIDEKSPVFQFPTTSFTQSDCLIDGKAGNLAEYLTNNNLNQLSIPLISDCNGALINRDIKVIDKEKGIVSFFAPLYSDEKYRLAKKIDNYYQVFQEKINVDNKKTAYSCLCVSYYNLANLETKKLNINGPFTFGEIAYQILNQTAVYLLIDEI